MANKTTLVLALLPVIVFGGLVAASDDERFGPAGEKRILELTRSLESSPITGDKSVTQEVLTWWIENPNLTLDWCAGMLIDAKNKNVRPTIVTQGLFGAGAYLIEHPDAVDDKIALHLAGVQSALRLYKTAVIENKKMRDKYYDELVERWKSDTLRSWVEHKVEECQESEDAG